MYRTENQISLAEFMSPFGKLDRNNRWAQIADMIPWRKYEPKYASQFCDDNGAPAVPFRMALGTLIIKQRTGHSDDEVLQSIIENPYMQYLIGLHEFTTDPPFSQRSITNFRKYIPQELIDEINEDLFRKLSQGDDVSGKRGSDDGSNPSDSDKGHPNQGSMLLDATCAPSDIAYPTDVNLLNEAREKLEGIIDELHRYTKARKKPRTYRQEARRKYLNFVKQRKPRKNRIRKAIGQQLRYVRRNIKHVDVQLEQASTEVLSSRQKQWLETIRKLYAQQEEMHRTKTHSIPDRIVSISQPYVRPIVRGKSKAETEFGAKVHISMVNGYAFKDKIGWDAYNEEGLLIPAVEDYKKKNGFYPEAVIADKIYRNRNNHAYCKERGIRLSGPKLGRPTKQLNNIHKAQERQDASARNAIEGKFGEGKTKYGLDRIMARLQNTSETVIAMVFLCMNISRRLRVLLALFLWRPIFGNTLVDNFFGMSKSYERRVFA